MKKYLAMFLLTVCAITTAWAGFTPRPVRAADLLFGTQQHAYSVILRGNGEAIVFGRIVVPNDGDEQLTEIALDLTEEGEVSDLVAYQQTLPLGVSYASTSYRKTEDASYVKMTVEEDDGKETFTFTNPILPGETRAIILAYRFKGYTQNNLGLYRFAFATPAADVWIDRVSVGVSVDKDLLLRGKETDMQYTDTFSSISADDLAVAETGFVASGSVARAFSSIGDGQREEYATHLAPGDRFVVEGAYAEHWYTVYRPHLIGVFVLLAILAGVLYFLKDRIRARWQARREASSESRASLLDMSLIKSNVTMGFVSALITSGWVVLVIKVVEDISLSSDIAEIFLPVIVLLISAFVSFAPSVWWAARRGWKAGLSAFALQIVWLIIACILLSSFDVS